MSDRADDDGYPLSGKPRCAKYPERHCASECEYGLSPDAGCVWQTMRQPVNRTEEQL